MSKTIRNRFSQQKFVSAEVSGDSLTHQSFAADADVNNIVRRHIGTRMGANLSNIGSGGTRQPIFGDFSAIDYQSMLNRVTDIDNTFRRLPARLRGRFRNDPYQLIRFAEDPANLAECVKLGLIALPEGQVMTEEGQIVEQTVLQPSSAGAPAGAPAAALKADSEAQPQYPSGTKSPS